MISVIMPVLSPMMPLFDGVNRLGIPRRNHGFKSWSRKTPHMTDVALLNAGRRQYTVADILYSAVRVTLPSEFNFYILQNQR